MRMDNRALKWLIIVLIALGAVWLMLSAGRNLLTTGAAALEEADTENLQKELR